tara:strand:+ start:52 stop:399 length:348 start_codon:yes stop_codon:yes gene_type:complete
MALQYSNITGNSAQTLVAAQRVENTTTGKIDKTFNANSISSISLCNIHATDSVAVDLWLLDIATGALTYKILNDLSIPVDATLVLDNSEASFDNINYKMQIQLSAASSAVDIIIK